MSSQEDIFEWAKRNESTLLTRFESLQKSVENKEPSIAAILAYLEENLYFSINFPAKYLKNFCNDPICKSDYELGGISKGRRLQRIEFDSKFEDSKSFKYAALNCGTVGLPFYGDFCLIFDLSKYEATTEQIVFLMRNSLEKTDKGFYYFDKENNLKLGKLVEELGTSQTKKELICIKLEDKIEEITLEEFPNLICKGKNLDYIEMIFLDGEVVPYLCKALTTKQAYKDFNKTILTKPSAENVEKQETYKTIHQFLKAQNITLEFI